MAATQDNMTCAICTEVYTSPRFLPCHHSFCLPCLEELAKRHGNIIPCPTCRARATLPPGGVCDLQVNFYFTDEALEQARSEGSQSMCSVHTTERVIFYCTQCEQAICIRCKLTKHDGHVTEDLSETVARCKKIIEEKLRYLTETINHVKKKSESCKQNKNRAQEKRTALKEQIQVRYDIIVTMAGKCRDEALEELQNISDDLEEDLAADAQRIQDELNSLLQLQNRANQTLSSSACDTEVLRVEEEMAHHEGCAKELRMREGVLSDHSYRPVLHGDFTNNIEDCMKSFLGTPVKLKFPIDQTAEIIRVGRCGDGGYHEVHALRQLENGDIDVYYGGIGGDYSEEKGINFNSDGSRGPEINYGVRISCVAREEEIYRWENSFCIIVSKGEKTYFIYQTCAVGECCICSLNVKQENEKESDFSTDNILITPEAHRAHNFDANKLGTYFAVVEEEDEENSNNQLETCSEPESDDNSEPDTEPESDDEPKSDNEPEVNNEGESDNEPEVNNEGESDNEPEKENSSESDSEPDSDNKSESDSELKRTKKSSRVVRIYSDKSGSPIGTYRPQDFFPTDVCFCDEDLLLIADWMNDCVHVTKVSDFGISFIDYLPGSGDMVRPTALNLDLNDQLLIGCGDGWVLRYPADISALFKDR